MKKIYSLALGLSVLAGSSNLSAQEDARLRTPLKETGSFESRFKVKPEKDVQKSLPIWENDFSVSSEWDIANSTADAQNWEISTSTATTLGYGTGAFVDPLNEISNENGYALFDSDAIGTNGGSQDATITCNQTIDLSAYPNVVLDFNQRVRMWQTTQNFVEISTDNGVTWTQFEVNLDKSTSVLYEESTQINISSAAGGQSAVQIRLRYVGSWDYAWLVDDLKIIEQPSNDIQITAAYIAGQNNLGTEYGRTMINHLDGSLVLGAQVLNFGSVIQTGVTVEADYGAFTSSFNIGSVASGDFADAENVETPTLTIGLYEGTFTVSSTEEVDTTNLGNNVFSRNFEVTEMEYAIDGLDVYESNALSSLGTSSFTDGADGVMFASWYFIKETDNFSGIKAMLTSATVPGGTIIAHIVDTVDWLANNPSPIFSSLEYIVTQQDVDNGFAVVNFEGLITLNPGCYYAVIECFSNGNENDIRIFDDQTVPQPTIASMIYLPLDATSFTNGVALGVRLMADDQVSLDESATSGVKIYPNPTEGMITIENDNNNLHSITVRDLSGKIVYQTTTSSEIVIDMTAFNSGAYFVEVANDKTRFVERIIKK